MVKKFLRRVWYRHSKLGKGRKKKQKWKRPTGRHNKMRLKRKGYQPVISVGYKSEKKSHGLINGKRPVLVHNLNELKKIRKDEIAVIASVGRKRKIELAKYAKDNNVSLYNLNPKTFLSKLNKEKSEK